MAALVTTTVAGSLTVNTGSDGLFLAAGGTRIYSDSVTLTGGVYTSAFEVTNAGGLASSFSFTIKGTVNSVVLSTKVDVVLNHSKDITVTSQSGNYTPIEVKILTNNNEDCLVQIKASTSGSVNVPAYIDVVASSNAVVSWSSFGTYTGTSLEHACKFGFSYSTCNASVTSKFVMDGAYAGGRMGIGTDAPTSKLCVGGVSTQTTNLPTIIAYDATNGASLQLRGGSPRIFMDCMAGGVGKVLMDGQGVEFKDGTLDSEGNVDVKIASDGNVGIGTTNPGAYKLYVNGTTNLNGALTGTSATFSANVNADNAVLSGGVTAGSTISTTGNITAGATLTAVGGAFSGNLDVTGGLVVDGASTLGDGSDTTHVKGSLVVDTNIYGPSLGAVAVAAGLNVTGGNVGIGITAPSQLLHVWKAGILEPLFQSTTGRVGLQLSAGAVGDISWILYSGYPAAGDFNIRESGVANHLVIKKTTGNATFSGSVTVEGDDTDVENLYVNQEAIFDGHAYPYADSSYTLGTSALRWSTIYGDAGNFSGNVGIGTTSPLYRLQVRPSTSGGASSNASEHAAYFGGNELGGIGGYTGIRLGGYGSSGYGTYIRSVKTSAYGGYWNEAITFNVTRASTANVIDEIMRIAADGKVGIGENAPLALLHLKGGTATDEKSHILFENTAGAKKFAIGGGGDGVTNNGLGFRNVTDDTLPMIIDDSGNVGIGTTAPAAKLHVLGDSSLQTAVARIVRQQASASNNTYTFELDSSVHTSNMSSGGAMAVDVYSGRAFTINGFGNVGIGTIAPGKKLDIVGETRIQSSSCSATHLNYNDGGTNYISTSDASATYFRGVSSTTMTVKGDGKVGIGTVTPGEKLTVWNSNISLGKRQNSVTSYIGKGTGTNGQTFGSNSNWIAFASDGTDDWITFGTHESGVGGGERVRIAPSGNVGIGTTTPEGRLHVYNGSSGATTVNANHDDLVIENSDNVGIQLFSPADKYQYLAFGDPASANAGYVRYYHTDDRMVLRAGATDTLYIKGGNVGIGVAAPGKKLEVVGEVRIADAGIPKLWFYDTSTAQLASIRHSSGSTRLGIFDDSNNERFTVITEGGASQGKVGIGTAAPDTLLDLQAAAGADMLLRRAVGDTSSNLGVISFGNADVDKYLAQIKAVQDGATDSARLEFQTEVAGGAKATRMTIKSDGNVGIGVTAPTDPLQVVRTTASQVQRVLALSNFGTTDGTGTRLTFSGYSSTSAEKTQATIVARTIDSDNSAYTSDLRFSTRTTDALVIATDGNVGIGTTAPSADLEVSTASGGEFLVTRSGNSGVTLQQVNGGDATSGSLSIKGGTSMNLFTGGVNRLVIDATGNVSLPADGASLKLGASADLQMWHGSDGHSYISNTTGAFWIKSTVMDGNLIFAADRGDGGGTFDYFVLDGGSATYSGGTTAAYTKWQDNSRIALGTGKDLQLYHDGSNSYIKNLTGWLNMPLSQNGLSIANADFSEQIAKFALNGACELYYDGSKKLATTSTGVKVTGILNADTLNNAANSANIIYRSGSSTIVGNHASALVILDTGNVGIGTTAPAGALHVRKTTANQPFAIFEDTGTNSNPAISIKNDAQEWLTMTVGARSDNWEVWDQTGSATRLAVTTGGKVGIGTDAPSAQLEIQGGAVNTSVGMVIGPTATSSTDKESSIDFYRTNSSSARTLMGRIESAIPISGIRGFDIVSKHQCLGFATPNSSVGHIVFRPKGTERVRIQADGNVGIGITTPNNKFEVSCGANDGILVNRNSTALNSPVQIGFRHTTAVGGATTGIRSNRTNEDTNYDQELTLFTQRGGVGETMVMKLKHDGKVGIGITNPGYLLDVNGTARLGALTGTTATFSGTITSGANLVSTGHLSSSTVYNSGNYRILNNAGTAWHDVVTRGNGDNYTVNALGGFNIGSTTVIDASRNITGAAATFSGVMEVGGAFTTQGYVQHTGYLYSRNDLAVLNTAGTGWNTWATRSNGQFNLNVNTITSGSLTGTSATFSDTITTTDGSSTFTISGDSSSNTYLAATGEIRIRPSGTTINKFVIGSNGNLTTAGTITGTTATFSGNVGIGITNPSAELHVNGDIKLTGDLGVGVSPSAWHSTYAAADFNTGGAIYGTTTGVSLASNLYYDGAWKRKVSGSGGNLYAAYDATYYWYTSNDVTSPNLSTRMKLNTTGLTLYGTLTGTTATFSGDLTVDGGGTFKRFANYRNLTLQRAQGTSAAPATVGNGQTLGKLSFQGYTGSVYREGASIAGKVTAGVSGDEIPSSLLFYTAADGATSPTVRLTIDHTGASTFTGALVGTSATFSGTVTGNLFSGSGASLTTLNATNISSGTLNASRLATSGATAASYTNANITIDNKGRVTAASNGSGGSTPNNATITLAAGTALTTGGAFTTNQSSNETITFNVANPFLLGDNTDTWGIIGRAKVGYIGHGDYAGFAHRDVGTTTSYALIQNSVGSTFLNAANAKTISFRINNANVIAMDATALYSYANGVENLGKSGNRWNNVYSEAGNFSGTVTGGTFSGSGAALTSLNGSNISSGTVASARLGTGTASSTTYLAGNGTWSTPSGGGGGSGTVTSVSVGTGLVVSSATTTPNITLDFNELATAGTITGTDDLVVVDGTATRKEQVSTISLSAFSGYYGLINKIYKTSAGSYITPDSSGHIEMAEGTGVSLTYSSNKITFATGTSSDYRIKKNISTFNSDAWAKVKSVNLRKFDFDEDAFKTAIDSPDPEIVGVPKSYTDNVGFIAHELAEVRIDGAVIGEKDAVDSDGNLLYQKVNYNALVPVLWGALNEAISKIETLESKVQALEDK